jgi:pimeloyl-ACP methyl ester carboxylesterase
MGLDAFFESTLGRHTDAALIAPERATYLKQWGQPGALTAMFNWYRASAVIVPAMDEAPARPAFLDAPFPLLRMPVLVIWGMGDKALLPVLIDGLDALIPDLTVVKVEGAGHFVPWEKPAAVTQAILDWLP